MIDRRLLAAVNQVDDYFSYFFFTSPEIKLSKNQFQITCQLLIYCQYSELTANRQFLQSWPKNRQLSGQVQFGPENLKEFGVMLFFSKLQFNPSALTGPWRDQQGIKGIITL